MLWGLYTFYIYNVQFYFLFFFVFTNKTPFFGDLKILTLDPWQKLCSWLLYEVRNLHHQGTSIPHHWKHYKSNLFILSKEAILYFQSRMVYICAYNKWNINMCESMASKGRISTLGSKSQMGKIKKVWFWLSALDSSWRWTCSKQVQAHPVYTQVVWIRPFSGHFTKITTESCVSESDKNRWTRKWYKCAIRWFQCCSQGSTPRGGDGRSVGEHNYFRCLQGGGSLALSPLNLSPLGCWRRHFIGKGNQADTSKHSFKSVRNRMSEQEF